jgi:hypothetical protein
VSFSITPAAGNFAAIAVTTNDVACTTSPVGCPLGETSGAAGLPATTSAVSLDAGKLICVYLSEDSIVAGGTATYSTSGLAGCGMLPVELKKFTVD